MKSSKSKKVTAILLIILVLGIAGYYIFSKYFQQSPPNNGNDNELPSPLLKERSYNFNITSKVGKTYYFSSDGSDSNDGLSPQNPLKNISRLGWLPLKPGDCILLRANDNFTGSVYLDKSGNASDPIIISSYRDLGASGNQVVNKPLVQGDYREWAGFYIDADYVSVIDIQFSGWKTGISTGDYSKVCNISYNYFTKNIIGVFLNQGTYHFVGYNTLIDNDKMMPNTPGDDDDYGAQAVVICSNYTEVAYNYITGHIAPSEDYGVDGSAIEIFGGCYNYIHHNYASGNCVFTEIGKDPSTSLCTDNLYYRNVIINETHYSIAVIHVNSYFGVTHNSTFIENIIVHLDPPTTYYGPILDPVSVSTLNPSIRYFGMFNNTIYTTYHPIGNYGSTNPYLNYFNSTFGWFCGNDFHVFNANNWSLYAAPNRTALFNLSTSYPSNSLYIVQSSTDLKIPTITNLRMIWNNELW